MAENLADKAAKREPEALAVVVLRVQAGRVEVQESSIASGTWSRLPAVAEAAAIANAAGTITVGATTNKIGWCNMSNRTQMAISPATTFLSSVHLNQ